MIYDVAVLGGGLGGLAAANLLAEQGWQVRLSEQKKYPFHKVCGEYISTESEGLLQHFGIPTENFPLIQKLRLTNHQGKGIQHDLGQGGIGVSRFFLDHQLVQKARKSGVDVREKEKIKEVSFNAAKGLHEIQTVKGATFSAKVVIGAMGKRPPASYRHHHSQKSRWVGIKHHLAMKEEFPKDFIDLHFFPGGYAGFSAVEGENRYCFCYLIEQKQLKQYPDFEELEQKVLVQNPAIGAILSRSEKYWERPQSISNFQFNRKTPLFQNQLLVGDQAALITPLCGNGMSMAMHAALLASEEIQLFLRQKQSRGEMEKNYQKKWQHHFNLRLKSGVLLQNLLMQKQMGNALMYLFEKIPASWQKQLVDSTRGVPFFEKG